MRKKRLLLAILILVFIIALIFAFRTDLKVMQYKISSEKIDFKIKMAFIADLHSCYYGEGQKELLDCINKHAPDIILFGGDIADDKLPHENWMITLEALSKSYPCYYVSGNHEYWSSDIENKTTSKTGRRNAWSLFGKINYGNLGLTLTGGKNDVTNKDTFNAQASLMGSYDSEYYVGNKATYYTADIGYAFKEVKHIGNITPYFMYSQYDKDQAGSKDSIRNILGVSIEHKKLALTAEYIMSKNDPFIGGNQNSLAMGDDNEWNKLLNLTLFYYF